MSRCESVCIGIFFFPDLGLANFVAGNALWAGDLHHVKPMVLTPKDSKGLIKVINQVSAQLRKTGCRCVLDEKYSTCAKPV